MVNTGMPAVVDEDADEAREIEVEEEITTQMEVVSHIRIPTTVITTRRETMVIQLNQCRRHRTCPRPILTRKQIFNNLKIHLPINLPKLSISPLDRPPSNLSHTMLDPA